MTLAEREQRIIDLVALGRQNKEIADALGLSDCNVRNIISDVYENRGLNKWGNPRVRLAMASIAGARRREKARKVAA